ncbi:SH3 domain-containing protein [Devosia sp. CN2-171]|uniref:SH3 domain-containing protein n=1 Tax=Devosia sp. CN2-171 TaxID=3400909 RepID=UPI003BF8AFE8
MAHTLASAAVFICVTLLAGLMTFGGLQFTLTQIAEAGRTTSVKAAMTTNYVSTLAVAQPDAFNIAKTVKVVPTPPSGAAGKTTMQTVVSGYTHTVGVESLRVRSGPNKATPQVFALKGGSKVTAVREQNGWILIDAGGRTGWVYRKFLRAAGEPGLQAKL